MPARRLRLEKTQEFADWWEGHKDSCEIGHLGSSPAIECAGGSRDLEAIGGASSPKICVSDM